MSRTYLKIPTEKLLKSKWETVDLTEHIKTINLLKQNNESRIISNKPLTNLFRRIATRQCKKWQREHPQTSYTCPICNKEFIKDDKLDCDHGDYTFDLINDYVNVYFKVPYSKDTFTEDEVLNYSTLFDKLHDALVTRLSYNIKGWTYMHPKCHKIDDHNDHIQHGGSKIDIGDDGKVCYDGQNLVIKLLMKNNE